MSRIRLRAQSVVARLSARLLHNSGFDVRRTKDVASFPGVSAWFEEDSLRAKRITDFLTDADFALAYARAIQASGSDYRIRWRTHVAIWSARHALSVPGDLLELGTGRGWMMSAILAAIPWESEDRRLFLCDRFSAAPVDRVTGSTIEGQVNPYRQYYTDDAAAVRENFAEWSRIHVVEGDLPESLNRVNSDRFAFVHVDLNAAVPEIESLERIWPRLSPGAVILLDDHAFTSHRAQYDMHRRFFRSRNLPILTLPTGQGLVIVTDAQPSRSSA